MNILQIDASVYLKVTTMHADASNNLSALMYVELML